MDTTKRDYVFATPFVVFALGVIGYGAVQMISSPPYSWIVILAVIASVIIIGPFQMQITRDSGPPVVGVAITVLALLPPEHSIEFGLAIWAIGLAISQTIQRRNLLHALYSTGLNSVAAVAFLLVQISLTALGVWLPLSLFAAVAVYYVLALLGEFVRQRGRWAIGHGVGLSTLSPYRVGFVILVVTFSATLMNYVDSYVIPWLERDADAVRTPLVMVLSAVLFYSFAQRARYSSIERRLRAVVDAAVELPLETSGGLSSALRRRAQSIVQANDVELRSTAARYPEIGAAVTLDAGVDQYLVASRTAGSAPFAREDQRALATIAHMATEAARVQHEVDVLERRANSDPLTGLPNYGAFQRALVDANENRPYHEGIALLFIDIDDFKQLNDTHGHHAGDELLRTIALRLQEASGGGDFVSRVGGDEFVVILAGLVSLEQAKENAERITQAVSRSLALEGQTMRPLVSAGLAFSSHRELDAQTLVVDADRAMLQVKRERRQGGSTGPSRVGVASHRSTRTNDTVARAIRNDRLALAFQPIVSLCDEKIWAFEALVRYVDPELGPISPPSLVARAKSLGLMNDLTRQVIMKALDAAEEFYRVEPSIVCMTVNLELGQISEDELGPFIREAAKAHPNISLCIELNERSLRFVTEELRSAAVLLQAAGVLIALDDYGSDDSSVGALVRFPMDILKIDKSLIDDLGDVRQREVIKALQGFGDNLEYTTVVEGIETAAMVEIMIELGVRNAQGYYYGRPVSFTSMMDRLRASGTRAAPAS